MSSSRTTQLNKANRVISAFTGMADFTNLGLIFILKQFFPTVLEETAKFALFPFAAVVVVLQALLGWNQVHINSGKDSGQMLRAIIATLSGIAITAAVVMALAFGKTPAFGYELGQIVPMIFAATIGINTLIHLTNSAYYGVKAMRTQPINGADEDNCLDKAVYPPELSQYRQAIVNNFLSAGLGAEITAAIITVMIYEQTQLSAAFGGATALTGNAVMLYLLYQQLGCGNKENQDTLRSDVEAALPQSPRLLSAASHDESTSTCCLPFVSIFNRGNNQQGYTPVPAFDSLDQATMSALSARPMR